MDNNLKDFEEVKDIDVLYEEASEQPDKKSEPEKPKVDAKKEALSWIILFACAVAIALVLNFVIFFNGAVPSGSMIPTIEEKNRLLGFRLAYNFSEPQRGDIIIFRYPDNPEEYFIKRIIGLPGDSVDITDGIVYITDANGEPVDGAYPLDEPYINGEMLGSYGPYDVPEGHYFVMGDNRNNSLDSRFWINTYVPRDYIMAKAMFRYWPGIKGLK